MSPLPRIALKTSGVSRPVAAEAVWVGDDVLVCIFGGEKPHIGAVAAALPRPSLADPQKLSATSSVLTFPSHKEDVVVKHVSEALAARLATHVVVTAGIHWDDLSPDDISHIVESCDALIDPLEHALRKQCNP